MKLPNSMHSQVNVHIVGIESGDINPTSYHLTALQLINQLLYIKFPSLECKIFLKDLNSTLPSSVTL